MMGTAAIAKGEGRGMATGRIEIEFERCKACELCVPACPKHCIGMGTEFNRQGYTAAVFILPEECTGCALCAETCPDVCIRVWR
jgi:2-oxoglutarate ferredoxin oxidoreductase subunit delta